MSSFSNQFQAHIVPSQTEIAEAMREGLIVLDTNVLLSAYRFAPKAREELLSVLEKVGDRAWVPYQVAFEFHKNRFEVIAEHDAAYKELLEALLAHRKTIESDLEAKIRQLSNRSALADAERDRLLSMSRQGLQPLQREIERLHKSHGLGQPAELDPVLARLQKIFTDHVGRPFTPEEEAEAEKEAARRVEERLPPGYKDSAKANPYGDYYLWSQTLVEAARRKPKFVILVTGDVKDDWYLRVKGQTIIGRPELAVESHDKTGARLMLMPTKSFLRHAQEYLDATVSNDTLQQAGRVAHRHEADDLSSLNFDDMRRLIEERVSLIRARTEVAAELRVQKRRLKALSIELDEDVESEGSDTESLNEKLREARIAVEDLTGRMVEVDAALREVDSRLLLGQNSPAGEMMERLARSTVDLQLSSRRDSRTRYAPRTDVTFVNPRRGVRLGHTEAD